MGVVNVVASGYSPGEPPRYFANVPVVFFKPDGSVGSVVNTDANGRASAIVEPGSLVAVVNGQVFDTVHAAIANPGDTLKFGPVTGSPEPNGSLTVSWPVRDTGGFTTYYYVHTPCGSRGELTVTSTTIPLYKDCSAGLFDVVVTSRRSSQGITGVMSRRDVQATGDAVTVNLADNGATWQLGGFAEIPLVNMPNAGESQLTTCTALQYLGALAFNGTGVPTSSETCRMRLLPEPLSTWVVEASFERDDEPRFAVQTRQTFPHGMLAPIDGADPLPWITSLTYDPASRQVTWNAERAVQLDASVLRIEVRDGRFVVWRIVAPHGLPTTFKIPALPAELAEFDLQPTDFAHASLVNIDYDGLTAADLMATDLGEENGFIDKRRRSATARTP